MRQLTRADSRRCCNLDSNSLSADRVIVDEWICGSEPIQVTVFGGDSGPDPNKLALANDILKNFDEVTQRAIELLEAFMKDRGRFVCGGLDLGLEAMRQECAFMLELGFTADRDPHEYGYTFFSVCFSEHPDHPAPRYRRHPFKFVVQFR